MVKDYSGTSSNLCTDCDGRGFHWIKLPGGANMPTVYSQGDKCQECEGTGVGSNGLGRCVFWLGYVAIALAVSAFVIFPLIRMWLD